MATSLHSKMVRTLFRGLVRSSLSVDRLGPSALNKLVGQLVVPAGFPAPTRKGNPTALDIVRHNFRCHAKYSPSSEDTKELVDVALVSLRTVNRSLQATKHPEVPGKDSDVESTSKPGSVLFSVGHVIRHRVYGYRGVIVGWHAACSASSEWVSTNGILALPHGKDQPFYLVLVDTRDRPDAQVSYVAQDNVELVSGHHGQLPGAIDHASRLVVHPLITKHFSAFQPNEAVYVPNEGLARDFPADSPTAGLYELQSQSAARVRDLNRQEAVRSQRDGGSPSWEPEASRAIRA